MFILLVSQMQHGEVTIALEFEATNRSFWPVQCTLPASSRGNPKCQTNSCGRVVWDSLIPAQDARELQETASYIMDRYGGADGGVSC
eukprot:m.48665 g.48665  ORF g.48665 m.48665 type:complete len:87 (-) comp12418_c0_seq1:740-1000(-)